MMGEVAGVGGLFVVIFLGTYLIQGLIWIVQALSRALPAIARLALWGACFLASPRRALAALDQAKTAAPGAKGYQPLDWPDDPSLYD